MPLLNDTDILFVCLLEVELKFLKYTFFICMGISWASMMAMPYQMLASSIPTNKMGVYMGIFNMFIVIPMIIQIFLFSTLFMTY